MTTFDECIKGGDVCVVKYHVHARRCMQKEYVDVGKHTAGEVYFAKVSMSAS